MYGDTSQNTVCRQYLLFALNFFVWVIGTALVVVGVWAKVSKGGFDDLSTLDTDPTTTTYIIINGCLLFCISTFGCLGALRQNLCLLYAYCFSLIVLLTIQLVGGVLVMLLQETVVDSVIGFLARAIIRYRDDADLQDVIDYVQAEFQCCGASSYADWQMNVYFNCSSPGREACGVPYSCCLDSDLNFQCGLDIRTKTRYQIYSTIYTHGCVDSFVLWMQANILLLGTLVFGSLFLQILALFLSYWMIRDINAAKKYSEETAKTEQQFPAR